MMWVSVDYLDRRLEWWVPSIEDAAQRASVVANKERCVVWVHWIDREPLNTALPFPAQVYSHTGGRRKCVLLIRPLVRGEQLEFRWT